MSFARLLALCAFVVSASTAFADSSAGLRFIAQINQYPADKYSAIWGYTGPDGREYALLGVRTGTSIVDITDEKNIHEVSFIPGKKSTWRELKTYKNYAYVVTDNADTGIQIIDLSQLPAKATLAATYTDLPQSHTVWTDEATQMLYTMGGTGEKVVALSIADPLHPVEVSRFGSVYVHDAYFRDGKAYLAEILSKSFSIYDISDIKNPTLIKRVRDDKADDISFHNSWLTEDSKYLVTTEESEGRSVKIWDLSDMKSPKMVSEYMPPNKLAHNVQIKGHYAYFSSYGGGIRIVDIKDPLAPKEVAYWAKGTGSETGFQSVWGCFPFFNSGKVIGSDIQGGLIIVEFKPETN